VLLICIVTTSCTWNNVTPGQVARWADKMPRAQMAGTSTKVKKLSI